MQRNSNNTLPVREVWDKYLIISFTTPHTRWETRTAFSLT